MPSAEAIKRGLEKGKGGVWIHTSGTDVTLPTGPEKDKILKEGKVYDDWEGIEECLTFPGTCFPSLPTHNSGRLTETKRHERPQTSR